MNAVNMRKAVVPLVKNLKAAIDDFMPHIGQCSVDIGRLNDALLQADRFLDDPVNFINEANRPNRQLRGRSTIGL